MTQSKTAPKTRRASAGFVRAARSRNVKTRVARALEPAAAVLFPESPEDVLTSRTAFEEAAMHTVIGDAGNLELCFDLVDVLASTVETLGLARSSDVPDPFRRVWICTESGDRRRGVVLRCENGEVAVFCPPSQDRFTDAGDIMKLSYRGFSSSVEYDLRLNDVVHLPGALVLHLTRPGGEGAIGRDDPRLDVRLEGTVFSIETTGDGEEITPLPCTVLDLSHGGMRIASELTAVEDDEIEIEVQLPGESGEAIRLTATVCWNRPNESGAHTQGLRYTSNSSAALNRYVNFLSSVPPTDKETAPALSMSPREADASSLSISRELESPSSIPWDDEELLVAPPGPEDFQPLVIDDEAHEFQSGSSKLESEELTALREEVENLQRQLEETKRRSEIQKANFEVLASAFDEAKAKKAQLTDELAVQDSTSESVRSLLETLAPKLDELEDKLSGRE